MAPAPSVKEVLIKKENIDRENHRVTVCVSDGSIDRDEEIIIPESYTKWLPTYAENAMFCWGHPLGNKNAPPEHCLGKAVSTTLVAGAGLDGGLGLVQTLEYAVKINPLAKFVWDMVDGGYLKAYSVGVIPHKVVSWWQETEMLALDEKYRRALMDAKAWCAYTESELVECSQCFVGSNRVALLRSAVADGCVPLQLAKSWAPGLVVPRFWPGADVPDLAERRAKPPDPPPTKTKDATEEPEPPAPSLSPDDLEAQEFEQLLDSNAEVAELFAELLL